MLLSQQVIEWQHVLDITQTGASDIWIQCCISQRTLKPFLYWESFNFLEIDNKQKILIDTRQWADLLLALYLQRIYILRYLASVCDRSAPGGWSPSLSLVHKLSTRSGIHTESKEKHLKQTINLKRGVDFCFISFVSTLSHFTAASFQQGFKTWD